MIDNSTSLPRNYSILTESWLQEIIAKIKKLLEVER